MCAPRETIKRCDSELLITNASWSCPSTKETSSNAIPIRVKNSSIVCFIFSCWVIVIALELNLFFGEFSANIPLLCYRAQIVRGPIQRNRTRKIIDDKKCHDRKEVPHLDIHAARKIVFERISCSLRFRGRHGKLDLEKLTHGSDKRQRITLHREVKKPEKVHTHCLRGVYKSIEHGGIY